MSGGEPVPGAWHLMRHHDPGASSSAVARIGTSSPACPVCRGSHGTRLVRSVEVTPFTYNPRVAPEEHRGASKYYPPVVPVLSPKSTGPISRSARWSFSVP
jgi:hypothetical protein